MRVPAGHGGTPFAAVDLRRTRPSRRGPGAATPPLSSVAQRATTPSPGTAAAGTSPAGGAPAGAPTVAAGDTPLYAGDPGYDRHLDRDGDGVACE
ncbi:excalibur calcium-binding domain-containing protein [Streptomyces sp. NPDC048751]|uniref:excalibur calcium-binding domain-containing protein n=1 Tax=Streptomyces sp. NPDC048751 TaxID=3365591 RepID=UPI003718CE07